MDGEANQIRCIVRLDRLRISSWCKRGLRVPKVKGFDTVRDIRLPWRGKALIYARVRELPSKHSATRAFWQYERRTAWVKQWRVTLIADDLQGITAHEAWSFCKHFRFFKLLLSELALDFPPDSGIDAAFVEQHGQFGKSRFRPDRGGAGQLRFGSRFSGKLVRCYEKETVNAYRVEIELHSSLLLRPRRNNLREIIDSRWTEIGNAGFSIPGLTFQRRLSYGLTLCVVFFRAGALGAVQDEVELVIFRGMPQKRLFGGPVLFPCAESMRMPAQALLHSPRTASGS